MDPARDVIRLALIDPRDDEDEELDVAVVSVHVNGTDLRRLVLDAQRSGRPDVDFGEPSDAEFLAAGTVAGRSMHWRGQPDPDLVVGGHAAVLTCSCGAFGCGGTAALITVHDDEVVWSDFVDPWGGPVPIGELRFDRRQYDEALDAIRLQMP